MAPTVLITGCTQGSIGYYLAKAFSSRNYHVFACSRRIEAMGDLDSIPNITLLSLDVTDRASVLAVHSAVNEAAGGKLDILYHNAAYRAVLMTLDVTEDESAKTFNTNLFAVIEMNRLFIDMVMAARGKIVFTGSISAYTPQPSQAIYNASKAALDMYSRILRLELKPFGVNVVNVITAGVKTQMSAQKMPTPPEGSHYHYLTPSINAAWDSYESAGMDGGVYARTVVGQIIRSNPPETIWCGYGAQLVRLIEIIGIRWLYARLFVPKYGLDRVVPSEDSGKV